MEELRELRVSNNAMNDEAELQNRMAEEGYLFFKQLQSPDKLRNLRREMMTAVQQAGWLIQGTDPMDGIADINRQRDRFCYWNHFEGGDGKDVYALFRFACGTINNFRIEELPKSKNSQFINDRITCRFD